MLEVIGIGCAFLVGPLALAAWRDRRRAEAQAIRAEVDWRLDRTVGRGLFAVRVVPGVIGGGSVYVDAAGLPEELSRRATAVAEAAVPAGYRVRRRRDTPGTPAPQVAPGLAQTAI